MGDIGMRELDSVTQKLEVDSESNVTVIRSETEKGNLSAKIETPNLCL